MLRMLRDRILIKPIERRPSSTIITVLHERPNIGEVIATGPGRRLPSGKVRPIGCSAGDIVRYGEFDFPQYHADGKKYLILQDDDIAGIVERGEVAA